MREWFSNLLIPAQGCGWPEPVLAAQGADWDPALHKRPFRGPGAHCSPPYPAPVIQMGTVRQTSEPQVHISGTWEETGVPGENPRRRAGEGTNSTQTVAATKTQFSPLITLTKRRWKSDSIGGPAALGISQWSWGWRTGGISRCFARSL